MILYPAIDIRGGHAVRLLQGDYERETVFDADPVDAALRWVEAGRAGASRRRPRRRPRGQAGEPRSRQADRAVAEVPVQIGGGLRSADHVDEALEAGAERAILGSAAVSDPALIDALTSEHGERIVVSADSKGGQVAIEGWARPAAISSAELIRMLSGRGARSFVFTPVEVDGTLEGPALEALAEVCAAASESGGEVVYSGGIGSLEHLRALSTSGLPALRGVIVGRALYDGRFKVGEALDALAG